MNKLEVLIATMNRKDYSFVNELNLTTDGVIINQNGTVSIEQKEFNGNQLKIICSDEKGLSKSRNKAIINSSSDICVIADDDITYVDNYADIIINAHNQYKEADIIAFQVERMGVKNPKKFRGKLSWENYLTCLKISSVEITFKRKSIENNNLRFNELMGAGSKFYLGEENIFLYDALRSGLKVLYIPIKIATVDCSESSWFEGYTARYFNSIGAAYYNMSNNYYLFLIIQFAFRKRKLYKNNMSIIRSIKHMLDGIKEYKNSVKTQ
ncbi:glycosyltransferase family A protein [Sutcliffiella cohnii]|uniref:glycosyltransferase family A protein n=1 Tax=Sutcliffiella cohnii TaxID=33932 RepID=UPI002E2410AB|nr:glycosyltransferase family A protein [Sutcliffiella cohnii]